MFFFISVRSQPVCRAEQADEMGNVDKSAFHAGIGNTHSLLQSKPGILQPDSPEVFSGSLIHVLPEHPPESAEADGKLPTDLLLGADAAVIGLHIRQNPQHHFGEAGGDVLFFP